MLSLGKKIPKKIVKEFKKLQNPFPALFLAKPEEIGREKEKKILVPNSVHTQPGQENSEKNSKKIQKIKKPLSGIIFRQIIGRESEKKILSRISFILEPGKKIPKKIAKKFKKLKNLFPALFLAKTGRGRPRKREKNFSLEFRSYSNRARKLRKK